MNIARLGRRSSSTSPRLALSCRAGRVCVAARRGTWLPPRVGLMSRASFVGENREVRSGSSSGHCVFWGKAESRPRSRLARSVPSAPCNPHARMSPGTASARCFHHMATKKNKQRMRPRRSVLVALCCVASLWHRVHRRAGVRGSSTKVRPGVSGVARQLGRRRPPPELWSIAEFLHFWVNNFRCGSDVSATVRARWHAE